MTMINLSLTRACSRRFSGSAYKSWKALERKTAARFTSAYWCCWRCTTLTSFDTVVMTGKQHERGKKGRIKKQQQFCNRLTGTRVMWEGFFRQWHPTAAAEGIYDTRSTNIAEQHPQEQVTGSDKPRAVRRIRLMAWHNRKDWRVPRSAEW